jgi:lipid A 3-O-deacylase
MGLEWEKKFLGKWFISFILGGLLNDGNLVGELDGPTSKKSLGCRILFREAFDFGYRFNGKHSVFLHLDHSSNASLCEKKTCNGSAEGRHKVTLNEPLESIGIRYGYLI